METLESSRVCRLCGKKSGISINIFDRNESHVKKINAILPIMVHEMDLLPKHMCHRCSYKLEEFHKFYLDCLKTDTDLKSQLSWMRRDEEEVSSERIGVPMVYIENVKIKVEPGEYGTAYELEPMVNDVGYLNPMSFPVNGVRQPHHPDEIAYAAYARCKYCCDRKDQSKRTVSSSYATMPSCGPDERTRRNVTKIDTVRHSFSSQGFRDSCTRPGTATTKSLVPSTTQLEDVHRNLEDSKDALKVMNVRNLRPRRKSVDYVGRKRNSPRKPRAIKLEQQQAAECTTVDIAKVKVEKPSDFEGRILRPRKTIDYIGPKRKYAKKNPVVAVQSDNRERKRQIKEESPGKRFKDKVKLEIKEELVDGFEDSLFGVQAEPGKPNVPLSQNTFTLPTRLGDVKNGSLAFAEPNYHSSSKKKLGSICGNGRIGETRYSANCIRREPAYPRKEKVRKLELRRNPSRRPGRPLGGKTGKVSLRSFPDTVSSNVRTVPGLNGRLLEGIKRYCEKCNISFANAELYRLHACYD